MAKFYPPREIGNKWSSELKVRRSLESLDDSWRVFHSVAWQSLRGGREADGEADFVLISRNRGLVVLEVKGGRISVENGEWRSVDRNGVPHVIKNPFEQAKDSKYALMRFLQELDPPIGSVGLCHGVVFPDVVVDSDIGLYGPRDIIIDREDLLQVEAAVERLLDHWGQNSILGSKEIRTITSRLAPSVTMRIRLREEIEGVKERLIELTEQQFSILAGLKRNRRAVVFGGAGTGKTVLAMRKASDLAAAGFNTLLTCFNRPLGEYLEAQMPDQPNLRVSSFHRFAYSELTASGIGTSWSKGRDWYEDRRLGDSLLRATEKTGASFDAVVIDEAQDFSADWITTILLMLGDPDGDPRFLFADHHQRLWNRVSGIPSDWPTFELTINCRNSLPIARRVGRIYDDEIGSLGAAGREPIFHRVRDQDESRSFVCDYVADLMNTEGFEPGQIAVLGGRGFIDSLRLTHAGEEPFVEIGQNGVVSETVGRFKGLEADVVVLVLDEAWMSDEALFSSTLYVGMSRARGHLAVVGTNRMRSAIGW